MFHPCNHEVTGVHTHIPRMGRKLTSTNTYKRIRMKNTTCGLTVSAASVAIQPTRRPVSTVVLLKLIFTMRGPALCQSHLLGEWGWRWWVSGGGEGEPYGMVRVCVCVCVCVCVGCVCVRARAHARTCVYIPYPAHLDEAIAASVGHVHTTHVCGTARTSCALSSTIADDSPPCISIRHILRVHRSIEAYLSYRVDPIEAYLPYRVES